MTHKHKKALRCPRCNGKHGGYTSCYDIKPDLTRFQIHCADCGLSWQEEHVGDQT